MGTARLIRAAAPTLVLATLLSSLATSSASAQTLGSTLTFLAGGALGLAAHEAGHLVMDVALGTSPGLRGVRFGPLPFFAITHDPVTPRREFAIASAGFWTQHASSEWIFARHPRLRDEDAPLLKGVLAFNVLTSAAYAGAAFARAGPGERDTRGMALGVGVAEPWIGAVVLVPAVLDAVRYYRPESAWVRWASRAAKIGGVLLIVKGAE